MDIKSQYIKYIRTFVPAIAGYILTILAGVDIEIDSAALETVVDGLLVGVATLIWYGAVNLVSRVSPKLQVLNGAPATPSYFPFDDLMANSEPPKTIG